MKKFSSIHLFAYGESQIISRDTNFKTANSDLSNLTAFVEDIKAKKPEDKEVSEHHVIHIFSDSHLSFVSAKKGASFNLKYDQLDQTLLTSLVDELNALIPDTASEV